MGAAPVNWACNGLDQVPPTYACDRSGVGTRAEGLCIEVIQSTLFYLDGYKDDHLALTSDPHAQCDVSFLTVAPIGCYINQYRFKWMMLTQILHVFTYDYFQLTRPSQSDMVFAQFTDASTVSTDGLKYGMGLHPGVPRIVVKMFLFQVPLK